MFESLLFNDFRVASFFLLTSVSENRRPRKSWVKGTPGLIEFSGKMEIMGQKQIP